MCAFWGALPGLPGEGPDGHPPLKFHGFGPDPAQIRVVPQHLPAQASLHGLPRGASASQVVGGRQPFCAKVALEVSDRGQPNRLPATRA